MNVVKYAELYPNMTPIDVEENGIIRGRMAEPCCVCGETTEYIEICSEAHFCSEECVDEFYCDFWRSINEMLEDSPDEDNL